MAGAHFSPHVSVLVLYGQYGIQCSVLSGRSFLLTPSLAMKQEVPRTGLGRLRFRPSTREGPRVTVNHGYYHPAIPSRTFMPYSRNPTRLRGFTGSFASSAALTSRLHAFETGDNESLTVSLQYGVDMASHGRRGACGRRRCRAAGDEADRMLTDGASLVADYSRTALGLPLYDCSKCKLCFNYKFDSSLGWAWYGGRARGGQDSRATGTRTHQNRPTWPCCALRLQYSYTPLSWSA